MGSIMVINVVLLMYSFIMCVPGHTGIRNILTVLGVVTTLYLYRNKIIAMIREVPICILGAYTVFCLTLIVASLLVNDTESIYMAFDFVKWCFPFVLVYLFPKNSRSYEYVLLGLALGVFYIGASGIYDFIFLVRNRVQGIFAHPNAMGTHMSLLLPVTVTYFVEFCRKQYNSKWLKFLVGIFLIVGIVGMFLTKSRGAILGVSIGLIITGISYCINNYKGVIILKIMTVVFIVSSVLIGVLYSTNGNKLSRSYDNERLLLIESSYNMWNDHKLYGIGLANWEKEYSSKYILPQAKEPDLERPHNIFAYYFSTTGLIGGIGFCSFLLLIIYYCFSRICGITNGGLFTLAILWMLISIGFHSCVDYGLIVKEVFRCFNFLLGFGISMTEIKGLLFSEGKNMYR